MAERKAQEVIMEHRKRMAWSREENRRLQELRIARLQLKHRPRSCCRLRPRPRGPRRSRLGCN